MLEQNLNQAKPDFFYPLTLVEPVPIACKGNDSVANRGLDEFLLITQHIQFQFITR